MEGTNCSTWNKTIKVMKNTMRVGIKTAMTQSLVSDYLKELRIKRLITQLQPKIVANKYK